jgi:hypothetical protein
MGERNAVGTKSGESVSHSDPGLRRPTLRSTVGRKPTARPPTHFLLTPDTEIQDSAREAAGSQPKNGRGSGQSPAIRARRTAPGSFTLSDQPSLVLPYTLNDSQITDLIQFFETLDRWDKEAHGPQTM